MIYQIFSLIDSEFESENTLHELLARYKVNDNSGWEFAKHYIVPALLGLEKSKDLFLRIVETKGYNDDCKHPIWETCYNYNYTNQIVYTSDGINDAREKQDSRILRVTQNNQILPFYYLYSDKPTLVLCSDEMTEPEKTILQLLLEVIPNAKQIQLSKLCEYLDKTFEFRKKQADLLSKKQDEYNVLMEALKKKTEKTLIKEVSEVLN